MVLGTIAMATGLTLLAVAFAWSRPYTQRPLIGVAVGVLSAIIGYRLASGQWTWASQAVHHAAALSGLVLLGIVLRARLSEGPMPPAVRLALLTVGSLVVLASWLWRARRRQRRPPHERLAA